MDPWADPNEVETEYGMRLLEQLPDAEGSGYQAVIHAVAHDRFKELDLASLLVDDGFIYDVKSTLPAGLAVERL